MDKLREVAQNLKIIESMSKIYIGELLDDRIKHATEYKKSGMKEWVTDFNIDELDTIVFNPNAGFSFRDLDSIEKLELEECLVVMELVKGRAMEFLENDIFYRRCNNRATKRKGG